MQKKQKKILVWVIVILLAIAVAVVGVVVFVRNQDQPSKRKKSYRVIKVESFAGDVVYERSGKEKDVFEDMNLKSKDIVTTGTDSNLELLADSDKHIAAEEETCFQVQASGSEKSGRIKIVMQYGTALYTIDNKLNEKSSFDVETPNATLSVRGTIFRVTYDEDANRTYLVVYEGKVEVVTKTMRETVQAGESAEIIDDTIYMPGDGSEDEEDGGSDTDLNLSENDGGEEENTDGDTPPAPEPDDDANEVNDVPAPAFSAQAVSELPLGEEQLNLWYWDGDGVYDSWFFTIHKDGTFSDGSRGKTDMDEHNGYTGEMTQIAETVYQMTVVEADEKYMSVATGLENKYVSFPVRPGMKVVLYCPGTLKSDLPENFLAIMKNMDGSTSIDTFRGDALDVYAIYLEEYGVGYIQTFR